MKLTPNEFEVAHLAYAIWEQEGRPHGRDQQHWQEAERLIVATPSPLPANPPQRRKKSPGRNAAVTRLSQKTDK
jgi:hypothetical protein